MEILSIPLFISCAVFNASPEIAWETLLRIDFPERCQRYAVVVILRPRRDYHLACPFVYSIRLADLAISLVNICLVDA
jgi:hypothetical protein